MPAADVTPLRSAQAGFNCTWFQWRPAYLDQDSSVCKPSFIDSSVSLSEEKVILDFDDFDEGTKPRVYADIVIANFFFTFFQILVGVGGEGTKPRVYADIVIDELELWSASKEKLVEYNFVPRGTTYRELVNTFALRLRSIRMIEN